MCSFYRGGPRVCMCLCMRVHVSVIHFRQGQCVFVYLTKRVRVKTVVHARLKQAVHMFGSTHCVYVCVGE